MSEYITHMHVAGTCGEYQNFDLKRSRRSEDQRAPIEELKESYGSTKVLDKKKSFGEQRRWLEKVNDIYLFMFVLRFFRLFR